MTHTDYRHGEPLPHRLPNRPQPHPMAPERLTLPAFKLGSVIRDCPQFPVGIPVHRVDRPRVTELFATVNVQLAWLNRTPIAMASGRINRNVFPELVTRFGEGLAGAHSKGVLPFVYRRSVTLGPTECHRTARANIRFHLYGGPQWWNPHFLRT